MNFLSQLSELVSPTAPAQPAGPSAEERAMTLTRDLKGALAMLFQLSEEERPEEIGECGPVFRILFNIESFLLDGLTQSLPERLMGRAPSPYPWLQNAGQCLPGSQDIVDAVNNAAAVTGQRFDDTMKTRLFLRVALNRGCLYAVLQALAWDRAATSRIYAPTALVRNEGLFFQYLSKLETLNVFKFNVLTSEVVRAIADPKYWETVDFNQELAKKEVVVVNRKAKKRVSQKKKVVHKPAVEDAKPKESSVPEETGETVETVDVAVSEEKADAMEALDDDMKQLLKDAGINPEDLEDDEEEEEEDGEEEEEEEVYESAEDELRRFQEQLDSLMSKSPAAGGDE